MPLFQNVQPEDSRRLFAAGKELAYYMEPPTLAVPPFVTRIEWTADGSSLLALRLVPPASAPPLAVAAARQTDGLAGMLKLHPKSQLVAWSRAAGRSRTLLDLDADRATIREIETMFGSDRALVLLSERTAMADGTLSAPHATYVLVAAATGAVTRLWSGDEEDVRMTIRLSPARPLGAIVQGVYQRGVPRKDTVALFGPDGRVGAPLLLEGEFGFAEDGGPGVGVYAKRNGKPYVAFHRIDPKTGAIGAEATIGDASPERDDVLAVGRSKEGILLYASDDRSEDESGLVSSEGTAPALSPKLDAVAFLWGSGAYVRNLVKVDRRAYEDAVVQAARAKAMRTAKQVGLGLLIYAADADDAFPLGNQKDSVDPYLKDRSALVSFTYTFTGGTLQGDPATIVLGFVAAPGGRAVVYADGTVVWVPD